jgi:hypothetical protein
MLIIGHQSNFIVRMNGIIGYWRKTGKLYLFTLGLFLDFFLSLFVYAACGFTPLGYVWMVNVFCMVALLVLFFWGYGEKNAYAMGWYTGLVFLYSVAVVGFCVYALKYVSTLCSVTSGTIGGFSLVFLVVPIIKFVQTQRKV